MKPLRDHVKIPTYWIECFKNLTYEEKGRLIQAATQYGFYNIEPTRETLPGCEWAVWPVCKKDLDWQFSHPRAYRFPENEATAIRASNEYKLWRNIVFERDDYTCRVCGKRGGVINAHHIKQFAKYPSERLDPENGITLCQDCHKAVHRGELVIVQG